MYTTTDPKTDQNKRVRAKSGTGRGEQSGSGQASNNASLQQRDKQFNDHHFSPRPIPPWRGNYQYYPNQGDWREPQSYGMNYPGGGALPQGHGVYQNHPPQNHGEGRYPTPLYNRYLPLDEDYQGQYHYQQGPGSFLGQRGRRGRGGGTPRGKNHPMNNRGGRNGPQQHVNREMGPPLRNEGAVEQDNVDNPRKRLRDT